MAVYKITQANALFVGEPGDEIETEPGPLVDAAVIAGVLARQAEEKPDTKPSRREQQAQGQETPEEQPLGEEPEAKPKK